MQTVVGRLTADAKITTLEDGRHVVNFTVAQNDRYKAKGSGDVKQLTTYYNCSYWMGTGIAAHLKKGMLIETTGRVGINAWQSADGEAKARITPHVQYIQLHSSAKSSAVASTGNVLAITEPADDLSF